MTIAPISRSPRRINSTMMPIVYFNGGFHPREKAVLSFSAQSVQYGTTVFSGIRGYFRDDSIRLFRLSNHYERLMNAVKIFGWDFDLTYDEFIQAIEGLIRHNGPQEDVYFRPFIYSADEVLAPSFAGLTMDWAIYMIPLQSYIETQKGLKLMTSTWRKFSDAAISTKAKAGGAYLNSSLARTEASRLGFDEALMLDDSGCVVEGTSENIGLMLRGEFLTPPLGAASLEGITLRSVIEFLQEDNVPIHRTPLDRSLVYIADEVILTGTAATVAFAESIDGRQVGSGSQRNPGRLCKRLQKKFQDCLDLKHPFHEKWVTKISV